MGLLATVADLLRLKPTHIDSAEQQPLDEQGVKLEPIWRQLLGPLFIFSFTQRSVSWTTVLSKAEELELEHRVVCECSSWMGLDPSEINFSSGRERIEALLHA